MIVYLPYWFQILDFMKLLVVSWNPNIFYYRLSKTKTSPDVKIKANTGVLNLCQLKDDQVKLYF